MNDKKENLSGSINDVPLDVLQQMNDAASYRGDALVKKTKQKRFNKRAKKRGEQIPVDQDYKDRVSKAQQLQQEINNGGNFSMNQNVGRKNNTNNIVGDQIEVAGIDFEKMLGNRESMVKQRTNLECIKEIGIHEPQKELIEAEFELLMNGVRSFELDLIPSKVQFLKYFNTYGAVAIQRIVNSSWWVYYLEKVDGKDVRKRHTFKDVKDHFVQPWIFSHAVNQFGRYTNNDIGITVDPVWSDFLGIGLLAPNEIATIAQKVAKLYELNGIKILRGVLAESASNPEIMTSHVEKTTVDGMEVNQYRQYFRHINIAEFMHCARVHRQPFTLKDVAKKTEQSEATATGAKESLNSDTSETSVDVEVDPLKDRFLAAFICAYDEGFFMSKNREVVLSAMKDI